MAEKIQEMTKLIDHITQERNNFEARLDQS